MRQSACQVCHKVGTTPTGIHAICSLLTEVLAWLIPTQAFSLSSEQHYRTSTTRQGYQKYPFIVSHIKVQKSPGPLAHQAARHVTLG